MKKLISICFKLIQLSLKKKLGSMSIILLGSNIGTLEVVSGIAKRDAVSVLCPSLSSVDLTGFESSVC